MLGAGAAALVAAAGGLALPEAAAQIVPDRSPRRMRQDYRRRGRDCFDYRLHAAKLARRRNRPDAVSRRTTARRMDEFPDSALELALKGLQHDGLGHVTRRTLDRRRAVP